MTNDTDIVEWLGNWCVDWDGSEMGDKEPPSHWRKPPAPPEDE